MFLPQGKFKQLLNEAFVELNTEFNNLKLKIGKDFNISLNLD